jgi:DNA-directed RNA polymerase subunit E'/Rpb7
MAKGKLISKADGAEYEVEFTLTTFANLKKEPVTGTVAAGKPGFRLTVASDKPIPDGDHELLPEGSTGGYNVTKSGESWSVV